MNTSLGSSSTARLLSATLAAGLLSAGCMIGPDYKRPPVPVAGNWRELPSTQPATAQEPRAQWWHAFNDPVLDNLIERAYQQNLSLRVAGLRVLEARAQRGIAVGQFFPQLQQLNGSYTANAVSRNSPLSGRDRYFHLTDATFDVAWELDVWGKFRRGIESADAGVYSSVMNYDDVLVTLVADVASNYITLRSLDERIRLAVQNVTVQQQSLDIANARFRAGGSSELDVQQARAQLADTQALIPSLQQSRRSTEYQLCTLLGVPPSDLANLLGPTTTPMPEPPPDVAVGIPADLLRRRPDIRRAEADAAAQCALIGYTKADLLPHFQLLGSIGYSAVHPGDLFNESSLTYQVGPAFSWDLFNYGRIENNVRVQDARFEQLIVQYQNTILNAQKDVENAVNSLLRNREAAATLAQGVDAALRSVNISMTQYRAGGADFIRVLNATQFLVNEQDRLVSTRANIAIAAVDLNRALGGGWELRSGQEFVPADTLHRMRSRTNWGDITSDRYNDQADMLLFPRSNTTRLPSPADRRGADEDANP